MNKWGAIGLAIAISTFVGANAILLFSDKSVIPKNFYVHEYERVVAGDFEEDLPKESLVAPLQTTTVYVKSKELIKDWMVKEGDVVTVGQELALLDTASADEQRSIWEAERDSLDLQLSELNTIISSLEAERANANSSTGNAIDRITEFNEEQTVNVDINVQVDVQQDGTFAQAIADAQQEVAEVNQQLLVIQTQLSKEGAVAVLSPVEGVVSAIRKDNERLAIDIFSHDKVIITYATDEQWQLINVNDRVRLQADGMDHSVDGTITSISQVPAPDSESLTAYKALEPIKQTNPLAYYEVRIQPSEPIDNLPFGNNTNAMILVNEAQQAVSVKTAWLYDRFEESATAHILNDNGFVVKTPASIAFDWHNKSVLTAGINPGAIVVYEPQLAGYRYAPAIFFPMPMDVPTWKSVTEIGWKSYLRYLIF